MPDNVTEELVAVLSSRASFEFKPLFDVILLNLRERNAASGGEDPGDGSLDAFMGVGDDHLHPAQAAAGELAQECCPEGLRPRKGPRR